MGTQADMQRAQKPAEGRTYDLNTAKGKNNLVFYLVSRFILVLVAVIAAESALAWLESIALLPMLQGMLSQNGAGQSPETTSVVAIIQWMVSLAQALLQVSHLQMAGLASRSLAAALLVAMLLLLALPIVVGGLVFAQMVVRKVRSLQEERERELELIERQRSQFITDVAHDIRTPLMAISGMAHALDDDLVKDEAMRADYLRSICDKSDKLGTLVSSVFDYTKLGSGSFALKVERMDLTEMLLREAALAYSDAEDAGMLLSVDVAEEPCAIDADPVQLARVVSNLIANAIRHNQPGTEISLLLVRQAGAAFVLVADTGDAILDDPDSLFEPFTRGDAARSATEGHGLGLSICKRIAQMHGFELGIAQPYGRFTKAFVLQCPIAS